MAYRLDWPKRRQRKISLHIKLKPDAIKAKLTFFYPIKGPASASLPWINCLYSSGIDGSRVRNEMTTGRSLGLSSPHKFLLLRSRDVQVLINYHRIEVIQDTIAAVESALGKPVPGSVLSVLLCTHPSHVFHGSTQAPFDERSCWNLWNCCSISRKLASNTQPRCRDRGADNVIKLASWLLVRRYFACYHRGSSGLT